MLAPEFMPVLSSGGHNSPKAGACIMEYISFLAGEHFSDTPECTDPVLASLARSFNDSITDQDRHLMLPFIPRLLGSSLTHLAEIPVYTHLRVWLLRKTLPNLPAELQTLGDHAIGFIERGERYPHNPASVFQPDRECNHRGLQVSPRTEWARRIFARTLCRDTRGLIESLGSYPYMINPHPGDVGADDLLPFFSDVIDEFDAAAGRSPAPPLTDETLLRCHALTQAVS